MDLPLFFTLPLLGGFAFVTGFFALRWRSARQDSQRLYYRAAVWGVLLAIAAAVVHGLLWMWPTYRLSLEAFHAAFLIPFLTPKEATSELALAIRAHVAVTCIYALLIGVGTTLASNGLLRAARRWGFKWAARANFATITDPLEALLSRALLNGEAIQVTLSTGKVYVGYMLAALDPDLPTRFIKIQPLMSGQRNEVGEVKYTTFYDEVLAQFERDPTMKEAVGQFQVVLPVDKVVTAGGFNLDAYIHFLVKNDGLVAGHADAPKTDSSNSHIVVPLMVLAAAVVGRLMS